MVRKKFKKTGKTGINWDTVKADLESQDWQDQDGGDGQERMSFLGTVFALMPSGKYYTPWANSNVMGCPCCNGRGLVSLPRKRLLKKWRNAVERARRLAKRHHLTGDVAGLYARSWWRYYAKVYRRASAISCPACRGLGSYEAALDEEFMELLEEEADKYGYSITGGEGDPCDMFAVEYRDKPEEEEEEMC